MQNLVSLFGTLIEESDPLVNELQELTLADATLTDEFLRQVSETTPLECAFESKKVVRIALHSGFQDARIDKLAATLKILAHKLLESNCFVHLTVMHLGLSEAVNGSLDDVIIYLARSIVGITYAHGGCAHNEEVHNRLIKLISSSPGIKSLNLEQCEGMTSTQLKCCAFSVRFLETLILAHCPTLESTDVAALLSRNVYLRHLNVAGCKSLQDSAFKGISKLEALRVLDLSRCRITDETLKELKALSIEHLKLQKCKQLTAQCVGHIAQFSRPLLSLDISGSLNLSADMLATLATRHMYARIIADCMSFDQKEFTRRYPFVTLSEQEVSFERRHQPLAVILQFLQRSFPDATCEFFTDENNERAVRIILSQVSDGIEMVPQSFHDYLKGQNVHLQIAYEILSSSVFCITSKNLLGAVASVTFFGTEQSQPLDIVGCSNIQSLTFINCPLRDTDLGKFASSELLNLKIKRAPHLTKSGFMAIPVHFPKLQSLDLRKCDNLSYEAIASLAFDHVKILENFRITKPKGKVETLNHLSQEKVIALLVKLAQSDLKGLEEALETIAFLVEIRLENFATLTFLAAKYKISQLQSRLAGWLNTSFKDSLILTIDKDRFLLSVTNTIADCESLRQLVSGILTTEKRLLLTILLTEEIIDYKVLTEIVMITSSCRDGLAICNQTKSPLKAKDLCEKLLSNERELTFERCQLGSEAFKNIVSKCPDLLRFHGVQVTGIGIEDVTHLLTGCPSIVSFGLVDCKEKLPKLLETIHRNAPQLEELDLCGADVSDLKPGMLPKLKKVNLANSTLQDSHLKALDQVELIEANFDDTRITNAGMFEFLSQPRKVEVLSLSGTLIDSLCLYKMPASTQSLRELRLARCKVTDDALLMLSEGLKQLATLDVMHCPSTDLALATELMRHAETTIELNLSLAEKYSPKSIEILMNHFRFIRSMTLTCSKETTYEYMQNMLQVPTVASIEKFFIAEYPGQDLQLLELIVEKFVNLAHFVWTGPVSFGSFTAYAKASKLQKLKILCSDAKAIVDVDGAILQLHSRSLKYLTLLGFMQFSPHGLERLLDRLTQLKAITLSKSSLITEEALQNIRSRYKTQITLV